MLTTTHETEEYFSNLRIFYFDWYLFVFSLEREEEEEKKQRKERRRVMDPQESKKVENLRKTRTVEEEEERRRRKRERRRKRKAKERRRKSYVMPMDFLNEAKEENGDSENKADDVRKYAIL